MEKINWKNDGRIKLLIIVGTRPEVIRLSEVIKKCRQYFDTMLAHTGQNYDYTLNGIFFHDLGLDDPEVYLDAVGDLDGLVMKGLQYISYGVFGNYPVIDHPLGGSVPHDNRCNIGKSFFEQSLIRFPALVYLFIEPAHRSPLLVRDKLRI